MLLTLSWEHTVTVGRPRETGEQLGHHAVPTVSDTNSSISLANYAPHATRYVTRWTSCPSSTEVTYALATQETPPWTFVQAVLAASKRQKAHALQLE